MSKVVWIVGEPGVGKTTLARAVLDSYGPMERICATPKWCSFGNATAPGWWDGSKFDGTDTLAISHIKLAVEQLERFARERSALIVIDGDKLSTNAAVEATQASGAKLLCFLVQGEKEATERRIARGTTQNASWVKGRRTKSARFYESFPGEKYIVQAGTPTVTQSDYVLFRIKESKL